MNDKKENTIDELIDALAAVDTVLQAVAIGVDVGPDDWAADCSKTINIAVGAILEANRTDQLQKEMIGLLEKLLNRAVDERDAARAELERRG
jgi:hypothetical protein